MKPRFQLILASSLVLAMCVCVAALGQPDQSSVKSNELKEWEFPGAESLGSVRALRTGTVLVSAEYKVDKPFKEVWRFYAKKFGSKRDYTPTSQSSGEGYADSQGKQFTVQILSSGSERAGILSSTLVRRDERKSVAVHISRGKDEENTYFTLIIQSR